MVIFAILVFLFFVILQATEQIAWSPVWITAPLWGVLVLGLCVAIETAIRQGGAKDG